MPPVSPRQVRDPEPRARLWIEHRRIAGWVFLLGPLPQGIGWLAAGLWIAEARVLALAAAPLLGSAALLAALRRRLAARVRAVEKEEEPPRPSRRLAFTMGLIGLVATALLWKYGQRVTPVLHLGAGPIAWLGPARLGWVVLAAFGISALFARFYGATEGAVLAEARGLAAWLRAAAWLNLLAGLYLLSRAYYPGATPALHTLAHRCGEGLLAILLVESILRGVLRRPARVDPATDLFFLRLVAARWNPISSLFATLTEAFGIDLRGTWSLRFIQRSLPPLALGLACLAWIGSSLTVVESGEVGVLETFGAPRAGEDLSPGLALHWPWPIQRVRRVDVGRVRTMPIGFSGGDKRASLLWTRRHAQEEYALLLGGGENLITVNAILHYRIADARAYLYQVADAERTLAAIADRALMQVTVGETLDGVLSENVALLSQAVERAVQGEADALDLGIEVVDFNLIGLHPPMAVARDYQAVVSAQIERDTLEYEAQADRERALPGAAARARKTLGAARAEAERRTALARGESEAFRAQAEASRAAPDLFRFRRLLEAREKQLRGRPFVVLDKRLEEQGAVIRATGDPLADGRVPPEPDIPKPIDLEDL